MKLKFYFRIILFLLAWHENLLLGQDFSDVYKLKLTKPDQYKLLKAETFRDKGKALVAKAGYFSQSQIADSVFSTAHEKQIEAYLENSIKASFCFKTANGLLFEVLDKSLNDFWAIAGNKNNFQKVKKIERAAYDSLIKADKYREMAESELYVSSKLPFVLQAEIIENNSLLILEKVLFSYVSWSQQPNLEWLLSADRTMPKATATGQELASKAQSKDTLQKATSIYSLLRIADNQKDAFNEFLQKKYPGQADKYLIDYQGLYDSVIDSLHVEWHKYLYSGKVAPDTLKPALKDTIRNYKAGTDTVSYHYLPFHKITTTHLKCSKEKIVYITDLRIYTLALYIDTRSKQIKQRLYECYVKDDHLKICYVKKRSC